MKRALVYTVFVVMMVAWLAGTACDDNPVDGGNGDNDGAPQPVVEVFNEDGGLANNIVRDILVDYSRNRVWIATSKGVSYYALDDSALVTFDAGIDVPDLETTAIAYDYFTADIWLGTVSGPARFSGGEWHGFSQTDSLPGLYITDIAASSGGTVWFGTRNGAAAYRFGEWNVYSAAEGLPDDNVTRIAFGGTGETWVGTINGLGVQSGDGWMVHDTPTLPSGYVQALFRAFDGSMWVGTTNSIVVHDTGGWTNYGTADGLPSSLVNDFAEDADRTLWVATDGGVARFDGRGFVAVELPAAVQGAAVTAVAADIVRGEIWIGTRLGVVRYMP